MDAAFPVLVGRCQQCPLNWLERTRLESRREHGRFYSIEAAELGKLAEIESRCRARAPRVVLVDLPLLADAGAPALRQLRREFPAIDWMLAWDAPPPALPDPALLSQLRGCIRWTAGADELARALDAVMHGGLWFPRAVLESLYLTLLETTAADAPAAPAAAAAPALTSREAEVRALMRHGLTNCQIAQQLGVSVNTVKKHLGHVFEKRGLHGRRQDFL